MPQRIYEIPRSLWRTNNVQFYPRPISLSSTSPFTGARSVYGPLSSSWVCKLTTVPLAEENWRELEAIFVGVRGISGLVRIGPPLKAVPRYNMLNAGTMSGFADDTLFNDGTGFADGLIPAVATVYEAAAAEADSLIIAGLPANLGPAIYVADVFEIRPNGVPAEHGHMYYVLSDGPTDGAGRTRISIEPPLRAAIAAGDQVVLKQPSTVMRASDDEQGIVSLVSAGMRIGNTGFTLIEELP